MKIDITLLYFQDMHLKLQYENELFFKIFNETSSFGY